MTAGEANAPVLSLVFPAYDEAANLPILLPRALAIGEASGHSFEIVIVDDGSRDTSFEVVTAWATREPRIRGVRHARNRGYGAALRTGLRTARGELVFFSDADLQFELSEIDRLLAHTGQFEIVAGVRAPRRDPWLRRVIARIWGWLIRLLFQLPVRDIDCAFKIFRREVLDAIPIESIGAFVNTEILVRARAAGFRIHQVPVTHHPRRSGRQTGARPRVIVRALIELFALYGKIHPRLGRPNPTRPARARDTVPHGHPAGLPSTGPSRAAGLGTPR
jgi:glycosyltransferase involved in cell wall biosynthesis